MTDVSKPKREIYVEPLEMPEPLRKDVPEKQPDKIEQPEQEPVHYGY